MASPQISDGFTRIANELLEAFARTRLAGREHQIVLTVARLTYGYGKKEDKISYGQIAKMTGISRTKVIPLVKGLILRKIMGSTHNGTRKPTTICINKNYSEWLPSPHKGTSPHRGTKSSPLQGTHQRKKEIKEIPPTFLAFSETFHRHQQKQHPTLIPSLSKQKIENGARTLHRLVNKGYDFDGVIKPALRWAIKDDFWERQVLSLSGLERKGQNGETKLTNLLAQFQAASGKRQPCKADSLEAMIPL